MARRICAGCEDPIEAGDSTVGNMHEACSEIGDGPKYCCGAMYDNGECTCRSCGEPL